MVKQRARGGSGEEGRNWARQRGSGERAPKRCEPQKASPPGEVRGIPVEGLGPSEIEKYRNAFRVTESFSSSSSCFGRVGRHTESFRLRGDAVFEASRGLLSCSLVCFEFLIHSPQEVGSLSSD